MRFGWIAAAAASVVASPASAAIIVGGAGGTFQIVVTSGSYNTDPDPYGPANPRVDLTGLVGTVSFYAKQSTGVPRNGPPFGFYPLFEQVSASGRLTGVSGVPNGEISFFAGGTNSDLDDGNFFQGASFTGDAEAGTAFGFSAFNGGDTNSVRLTYSDGGSTGSGVFLLGNDDLGQDFFLNLEFDILSGQTFAVVPEPSSWAMMIVGVGAVGGTLRRRKAMTALA